MDTESRRCTASQFFMEEEQSATESLSTYDRVVELLNQASLLQKDTQRVNNLKLVQELIVHKEPNLLDNFLDEMLAFQSDRSTDVKKTLINFIEDACKTEPDILAKVIGNVCLMLKSDAVPVVKKVILSMATLYKVSLQWVCKAKKMTESIEQTWDYVNQIKRDIIEMIDSDNEGFRTHSIKFVEAVIIALSRKTAESIIPVSAQTHISLDQIPETHSMLKLKRLEEEGESALETVLSFMGSLHISSVNLMTCMGTVTTIARQRPQFMARVVQSFETLHVNLPPTLSKSQVASVRKNMKLHMLSLLRHPAAVDFHAQITTLLTDLGATQSEVMKAMPKEEMSRKRKAEEKLQATKKAKVQQPDVTPSHEEEDDYGMTPYVGLGVSAPKPTESLKQTAIDISAEDLITRLTAQNVADLVLLSMPEAVQTIFQHVPQLKASTTHKHSIKRTVKLEREEVMLPDTMPAQFQATYTPIAAAGTQAQIKHLSRLLATQLTAASLGKGYAEIQQKLKQTAQQAEEDDVEVGTSPKHVIQTVVGGSVPSDDFKKPPLPLPSPAPNIPRKAMRAFKLSSVTKPLDRGTMDSLALQALERILLSEKTVKTGECASAQMKIATCLVAQFGGQLKDELQNFIFVDLRNRAEIALAWIYQEYANFQGYNLVTASAEKPNVASYDECLTRLLTGLLERPDQREGLFSRLILEAPYITPNAIQVLKKYCQDETRIYLGMTTLKELIVKRPCMKLEFLDVLLDFTSHEKNDVRNNAIRVTKKLHERKDLEEPIERYALFYLKYLLQSQPPPDLPNPIHATGDSANGGWNEDSIKLCLYLYLGLLPINHRLIHELANVYTGTKPDIKRTILRVLETPVKGMGMDSPELLLLVDNCPKGAETLITRIIHILTDKAAPSQALVDRVRDLYHKRVSDVRFLIPVLTGLSKKEVVAALPKLIKLNPVVVKEVFNRLLGAHGQDRGYSSPLTPAELLIALHYVDTQKCDMKTIIKATNLCFAERTVYTQEVLAVVMQHLMEQSPLPTLLMRTVLQSLAMYPRLIGFVMNIMQRLITKQVWKQKKVWEGFVRCCQRTKPQSFQVLLQLPALQLKNAFEICPDLREPLLHHVKSFTPHQRAHIPKAIMTILEKDPLEEQRLQQRAKKVEEERLATQEKLYQHKLEEERHIQLEKARQRQLEEEEKKEQKDKEDQDERQLEIKRDEDERKKMEEERERQQEQKEKEDQDERQLKIKRDEDEQKKMEEERDRQQADIKQEQEIKEKSDEEERDRKQELAVKQEQTLEQERKQEEERQLEVARKQEQERKEVETKEREEQLAVQRLQQKEQEAVVMETDGIVLQDETCQPGPVREATEPESVSDREVAMETSSDVTENMTQVRGSHRSCGTDNCQVDEARTEASATEVTGEGQTGDSAAAADSDTVLVKKSGKRRAVKDTEGKNKSKSAAVTKRRSPRTHKS